MNEFRQNLFENSNWKFGFWFKVQWKRFYVRLEYSGSDSGYRDVDMEILLHTKDDQVVVASTAQRADQFCGCYQVEDLSDYNIARNDLKLTIKIERKSVTATTTRIVDVNHLKAMSRKMLACSQSSDTLIYCKDGQTIQADSYVLEHVNYFAGLFNINNILLNGSRKRVKLDQTANSGIDSFPKILQSDGTRL